MNEETREQMRKSYQNSMEMEASYKDGEQRILTMSEKDSIAEHVASLTDEELLSGGRAKGRAILFL